MDVRKLDAIWVFVARDALGVKVQDGIVSSTVLLREPPDLVNPREFVLILESEL